ncbi:MAG: hypothetical protein H9535_00300 [Ignavibacteria bacterium]|nr:hypothetical protein [Ignavibacteria bacterium]MBL7991320.1 hypothetical protein [Candidatus Kapabacteria bacterium]
MTTQDFLTKTHGDSTPEDLLKQTTATVEKLLKEVYPDYSSFGDGSFTISQGSSMVSITVRPFTANETCVECTANVVYGAEISPAIMKFLLRKNAELHFGGFGLLFDGTITFSYSFPGTHLDKEEFHTALTSVAIISDYYDDEIVAAAGGKRAMDMNIIDLESQ